MRDKIIERVINKIKKRSDVGYKKEEAMLKRYMVGEDEFNNNISNIDVNEEEIL